MGDESEHESVAAQIGEHVAEVAEAIIAQEVETAENSVLINEALVEASLERIEEQRREEFRREINDIIGEQNVRFERFELELNECRSNMMEMQSKILSILQASPNPSPNPSPESAVAQPEVENVQIAPLEPEVPKEPESLKKPAPKRKTTLI